MKSDMEKILISEEEIQKKVKELGAILAEEYKDKNPLLVGVLKGGLPFMADLIKAMEIYLEIDFMDVSSYGNETTSSGEVKILKDLDTNVEGRHVLFVEDIIDTGRTLAYLKDMFKYRKAASVKIVTLLDKPSGRAVDMTVDWIGFEVPHEFVVGYGLDFAERYRNLPYIGVLKPEIYQ
ncbi:hypoxanthine phosphoribosyltransferase [Marinilactibacillus sp. 15R]|uniref:hypoxanthine phosphoribosyltransferase n=1 Tax=Marinilactibacillus sp. 15R TaxID=1911586 RepID=UPI00090C4D4A|nr:hypoxanthine phosphoribosyltransferase [Marinilactibacillus sp. 15R]API87912.1 hypoxanthine phosphoribosyltransferase [Marinilactibacillus sp. 15R]